MNEKLKFWQERLSTNETSYQAELVKMDRREQIYRGSRDVTHEIVGDGNTGQVKHVRNIAAELIESQISTDIPQPKVTAKRKSDEWRAKIIEDMLRCELDRLPVEDLIDIQERTVPIQGGGCWLVEWDNTLRTHKTVGDLWLSVIHPKQLIPQDGVSLIEDMDYVIIKLPQTKEYIKRRYGKDVYDESEEEPDVRGLGTEMTESGDLVTQYIAYYRNDKGGIGMYSWVRDVELCDYEDYQARRVRRCKVCGEPAEGNERSCDKCGGELSSEVQEYEELPYPITLHDGRVIGGVTGSFDEEGNPVEVPVKIPYYKPDVYPVVLQKNVSVYGRLLGESDIDKISDQQNTTNIISKNIIEKLLKGGSYAILPDDASIPVNEERKKIIRPGSVADASLIRSVDLTEDISQDMTYLRQVYEEARQVIGITDSFQGRRDPTATSGKAKEFAAAQTAGRLDSKRQMKNAAFAKLFEIMFKFKLAYADEPRPVMSNSVRGDREYSEFSRYDFLEQDEAGEWYYVDDFLFSVDSAAPLASNREAMWQETRMNLQSGAFGNPQDPETLIMFWAKMEQLHYPGAAETKKYLEEKMRRRQEEAVQQQQLAMQQAAMQGQPSGRTGGQAGAAQNPAAMLKAVDEAARRDALNAIMSRQQSQTANAGDILSTVEDAAKRDAYNAVYGANQGEGVNV